MSRPDTGPVVVVGEALVDLVPASDGALRPHPGGGPFNAARTVARLGVPSAYLGRLSSDGFGAILRERLVDDGVLLDAVVPTDDPTTLSLVELDERASATYRFYFAETSAAGLTPQDAAGVLPAKVPALLAGTLGIVLEPSAQAVERLVADAHGDTLVALDPNCRPTAIDDEDGYRERLGRLLARTDLVKASDADLEWLVPGAEPADAMRVLLDQGPELGLVTLGGDGALVVTGDAVVAVEAPRVEVVDTIGAGDAFAGALLAWWQEHGLGRADVADREAATAAARFAARVAALTCAQAGANPPTRAELDEDRT